VAFSADSSSYRRQLRNSILSLSNRADERLQIRSVSDLTGKSKHRRTPIIKIKCWNGFDYEKKQNFSNLLNHFTVGTHMKQGRAEGRGLDKPLSLRAAARYRYDFQQRHARQRNREPIAGTVRPLRLSKWRFLYGAVIRSDRRITASFTAVALRPSTTRRLMLCRSLF